MLRTSAPKRQTVFSQRLASAHEVILEVKGGEGGDDSKLFAHDLFAAISTYARRHGLKVKLLASASGHVSATVSGQGVWRRLQTEIGTHCVQRVPPTETRGRRHTSYLAVAVLPIIESAAEPLEPNEIEVKTQRGHGPGGQHQNKTDSAVRMTHLPTGIKVFINGRDQHANRSEALRILTARVWDEHQQRIDNEYRNARRALLGDAGRGKKIRTYNYIDGRAVDHRNGRRSSVQKVIEKGEIERLCQVRDDVEVE